MEMVLTDEETVLSRATPEKKSKEFNTSLKIQSSGLLEKIMMKSYEFFRKVYQCKWNIILEKRIVKYAKNQKIINPQIPYGRNGRWKFSQERN